MAEAFAVVSHGQELRFAVLGSNQVRLVTSCEMRQRSRETAILPEGMEVSCQIVRGKSRQSLDPSSEAPQSGDWLVVDNGRFVFGPVD